MFTVNSMEMKMLIKLTDKNDDVLLINPTQVTTILKNNTEYFTRIYFVDGNMSCVYVKETPEEIYVKLNNI